MNKQVNHRVWDLPTRLFHWSLLLLVCVSLYTGLTGGFMEMDYHMMSGYGILGLVIFRILWGFLGSTHARFTSFLTLQGLAPYTRHLMDRDQPPAVGHNPLGGWSVVALLLCLLVQAGTGLFANDDIMLEGPLVHLVSDDMSNLLTEVHETNVVILYLLIGLHLLALTFHELYRKERLVIPMITGRKAHHNGEPVNIALEWTSAVILALITAGLVYWIVNEL